MNKSWSLTLANIVLLNIIFAVSGCGNTGPEEEKTSVGVNNSSFSGAVSSSHYSSVASLATSSAQGGSSTEYSLSVETLQFVEGSDPETNKVFPISFSFNKPLEYDATISIKLHANFGTGIYPGKLSPSGAISLKKGTSKFSVQLESYVNNIPESTKTANWIVDAYINGESKRLSVDNNVVIQDDDKMVNKEVITTAGKLVEWDLNGIEKQDTNDTYTVTQKSGAAAAFEIQADKLRILVPAPNNYRGATPAGVDPGDLKFQVVSSQGENYELALPFMSSTRFKLLDFDIDHEGYAESDEEAPGYQQHYLQSVKFLSDGPHHLIGNSYGPPVMELAYLNSNIKITGNVRFTFSRLNAGSIVGGVDAEIDSDGKTIKISAADWEKIKQKVDLHDSGLKLETEINLRDSTVESAPDSENYVGQDFNLVINLRMSEKTATVTVDSTIPDEVFKSGNIFLVLRDNYEDAPGDGIVLIKPLSQRVTEFGYLYGSDFDVSIADLSGQYSGSVNIPLDDKSIVNKAVTIKASSKPKQASAQKKSSFKLLVKPTGKEGECWDDEAKYVVSVRSTDKDKENKCSYTFQKDDFVYDEPEAGEPHQKTQLVIQVSSLEWPTFSTAKATQFDDLWSVKLKSNRDIGLTLDEKSVSVRKSHFGGRNKYFVSNCIDFSEGVEPEITVEMAAVNKGDSQLATEVAAYVRECQQLMKVDFVANALGALSGSSREFRFINPVAATADYDAGRMYLSIPKELPSTISTSNAQRKFNAYIDIVPSTPDMAASSVTIDSVLLTLLQPATGETVVAELEEIGSTSTKLSITDKAEKDGGYARDFKRITMENYSLPDSITNPTSYDIFSGSIMIAATIRGKVDDVEFETEPSLMNVTVASRGISKAAQFYPLYEIRTVKSGTYTALQDASRWNWNPISVPATGGGRYGGRDDNLAGDGWVLPELWRNLLANALPAAVLPGATCTSPVPPLTTGHCDADLNDNNDFIDELRLGDASAFNSRCKATVSTGSGTSKEDWSSCRAITGHASHHNGRAWDVRYLMPNGTVQDTEYSGQGNTHFYNRWCAYYSAATPASKTAIRQELRKFILRNRNFIEWIQTSMADTSTPFRRAFMGKNFTDGAAVLATCSSGKKPPSIRDFIVNGTLPGMPAVAATPSAPAIPATPDDNNTPADVSDDNLDAWDLADLVKAEKDHDHHIHLDFDYVPVTIAH